MASAAGLIPFGHLGWGFRDRDEFLARAAEYIADGLAQNQWVEFVGSGDRDQLRRELESLRGVVDVDRVVVTPALEFYDVPTGTDVVDPEIAVAVRSAAVLQAIDLGYSGFRAIVDATSVATRPEQRDAFARFEFLIDQKMAALPVSALCAYDMSRLDGDAASLVCLHPLVEQSAPPFRIYADEDVDFALAGEIDPASAPTFASALNRIGPIAGGDTVTVDARNLQYIGHPQLIDLDNWARSGGRRVLLRTRQPVLTRLAHLLDLSNVAVAAPVVTTDRS